MRSARLAILVSSDRRRGAEVFGETLWRALPDHGWTVDLWSLTGTPSGPTVPAAALSVYPPDRLPRIDRRLVASLRSRVAGHRPQVVLANGSSTMQYAVAALRTMRRRPRLVFASIGEPMYWVRGPAHRWLRTAILKGVDRVLSVSAVTAHQLVDDLGVPPGKVRIAPTGVPDRFFTIEPEPPAGELRVAVVGALSVEKDPEQAMAVIDRVAASVSVRARFVGGGPLQSRVETMATDRGLADRVAVLGPVPDVAPHLAWADVLLLTSRTEGLPGVVLEAGAAGVPAVVHDVGGARETVVDAVTGRVVAPGDTAAAVAALVELATDPDLGRRRGAAARSMVAERFTLASAVARYHELLGDELR